jgi:hypothetical protein
MSLFGWKFVSVNEYRMEMSLRDMEVKNANARANAAEEYARKCEKLVDHERERIDGERERADRIADSLFVSSGLPPASSAGVAEAKAVEAESKIVREDALKEMAAIFQESWDEATAEEVLEGTDVAATP